MSISAKPVSVLFDGHIMHVRLDDGHIMDVELLLYPRLRDADPAILRDVRLSRRGLHWDALDEDISIAGLLAGRGDLTGQRQTAA